MSASGGFPWLAFGTVMAFLAVVALIDPQWAIIIGVLAFLAVAGGLGNLLTSLGLE